MSDTVEFDLVRLTAQSSGPDQKEPGGGQPAYSVAEIRACLGEVPWISFHCLLAKYCDDETSIQEVLRHTQRLVLNEWFNGSAYMTTAIKPGQLKRVAELAVISWVNPLARHTTSLESRAAYAKASRETFRTNFQQLYAWALGELVYLEDLGDRVYRSRKYGRIVNL